MLSKLLGSCLGGSSCGSFCVKLKFHHLRIVASAVSPQWFRTSVSCRFSLPTIIHTIMLFTRRMRHYPVVLIVFVCRHVSPRCSVTWLCCWRTFLIKKLYAFENITCHLHGSTTENTSHNLLLMTFLQCLTYWCWCYRVYWGRWPQRMRHKSQMPLWLLFFKCSIQIHARQVVSRRMHWWQCPH